MLSCGCIPTAAESPAALRGSTCGGQALLDRGAGMPEDTRARNLTERILGGIAESDGDGSGSSALRSEKSPGQKLEEMLDSEKAGTERLPVSLEQLGELRNELLTEGDTGGRMNPTAALPKTAASDAQPQDPNKTRLTYKPTSGAELTATPGKTTTVLGSYQKDMGEILTELGNITSMDFGPRDGGFNLLNVPHTMLEAYGHDSDAFWQQVNKPWLEAAIARNDIIILATAPTQANLYRKMKRGNRELTGFGYEYFYLLENGYVYDAKTRRMVRK